MKRNLNDDELLNKINQAFKEIAPEGDFLEVRRRINRSQEKMEEKKKFNFKKIFIPAIALCTLLIAFTLFINKPKVNGEGYISIDINPGFELYTDKNNIVEQANPVNLDAKNLLDSEALVGLDVTEAVKEITDKAIQEGYITSDTNQDILVSVSKNLENTSLQTDINNVIINTLEANDVTARVNTTVVEVSEEIIKEASELGTTLGKLNLVGDDLELAIASITDIIRENATKASEVITNVSYNTSTNVSSDLEKYKELLAQELELEAQKEKLELAYTKGEVTLSEYRNLKSDLEKELAKLDQELDLLEDSLEKNGFYYEDTLDYIEDQIKKDFYSKEITDQELKTLYSALAAVNSQEARLKTEYRSGLIDKKTYEYEEEKLDIEEDYLEDLIEYYEKEVAKGTLDKSKYNDYKQLLEKRRANELAYLEEEISYNEFKSQEKSIEKEIKDLLYAKIDGEVTNFENYYTLKKELSEQYLNGLISKYEYEKRLDMLEDYLDELEDYFEDGLDFAEDLEELADEYRNLTGASKYLEELEQLYADYRNGLITIEEFIKEKVKIEELLDNLADLSEDIEDSFIDASEDIKDFFEDLDEAFYEFGSEVKDQILEFKLEVEKLKEDLENGSITYQEFKRLFERLEERFESLEDRYDDWFE